MKINQFSSLEDRFNDQHEKGPGCWEWTGRCSVAGYGQIKDNYRTRGAHRVSYEIHNGAVPEGLQVLHHCDNPPCVNPEHLFIGTHQDNMDDKVSKNRQQNGYQSGGRKTKLCDFDIWLIRNLELRNCDVARFFDLAPSYVSQVRSGARRKEGFDE